MKHPCVCIFQPFRVSKIRHEVNFEAVFNRFEFRIFIPFSTALALCEIQTNLMQDLNTGRCVPTFLGFYLMQTCSGTDTFTIWKNYNFILSKRLDFHMIDNLSPTVHVSPLRLRKSLSVDEIFLPRYQIYMYYVRYICIMWLYNRTPVSQTIGEYSTH